MVLLMFPHQYWFMNAIILLVDQWFNACTVVKSGNFRVSSRTGLLFDPNRSLLSLSNQELLNFETSFSFSEANCWGSLASFSKLSFGENIPLDHDRGLAALGPIKDSILVEISAK